MKLDNNVEERIDEAKKFMENNKDIIDNQFKELCELEEQLFNIVEENNKRKELDKEYYELMKSQKFMDLGNTMRNMKEKIKRVNNFLVENGKKKPFRIIEDANELLHEYYILNVILIRHKIKNKYHCCKCILS